jgi:uncharacterized hydrophobic protein (TIGR00271 family)
MFDYFREKYFNIKHGQLSPDEIHEDALENIKLRGAPLVVLFCAIIIASIGLATNSTAVIIGAMLISTLMNPIITVGYSIATYDSKLLRLSLVNFGTQVLISIAGATLFFIFAPINAPTSELIARTHPTFYDMMIGFFGGVAGVIGFTREEKTNVIPGVAIATALMPPMCTIGYGIATLDFDFIFNASFLFIINSFFIVLATFLFCKLLTLKQATIVQEEFNKVIKRTFIIGIMLILIPLTVSTILYATSTFEEYFISNVVNVYISDVVNSDTTTTIRATINPVEKTLRLDLAGEIYDENKISDMNDSLDEYGMSEYTLTVIQDLETTVFDYFNEMNSVDYTDEIINIQY